MYGLPSTSPKPPDVSEPDQAISASAAVVLVRQHGEFFRVARPEWLDKIDTSVSADHGGRWNPPASFGVLYLNADIVVARANTNRLYEGRPYGLDDFQPSELPVLVIVEIPADNYVDALSDEGLDAVGLPPSYPLQAPGGDVVAHHRCQHIGQTVFQDGELGIACRSAATRGGEGAELAWFHQEGRDLPAVLAVRPFDQWYP